MPLRATQAVSPGNPLGSVLVLGDSASSGFRNGSLLDTQQPHGRESLVAAQAGFPLRLPLIAAPGFPNAYTLVQGTLPPVLGRANGATIGRDDQNQVVDNFATPGHTVHDILDTAPPPVQPMAGSATSLVLGYPAGTVGTLVDLHGALDALARDGVTLNGYHATTHYLGGLYSLDGIHPSNTGYAVFSNQFIAATNTALGLHIPPVDAAAVAATDPLFGPGLTSGYTPYNTPHMTPEAGKAVDSVIFNGTVHPR